MTIVLCFRNKITQYVFGFNHNAALYEVEFIAYQDIIHQSSFLLDAGCRPVTNHLCIIQRNAINQYNFHAMLFIKLGPT